jgi:hypothetical protein
MIPLEDDDLDLIGQPFGSDDFGFTHCSPALVSFLTSHSHLGPVVYFETEYFGGMGTQAALAIKDGCRLTKPPEVGDGSINRALRMIGVFKQAPLDEFDHVGISMHRNTSDWKAQHEEPSPPTSQAPRRF